MISTWVKFSQKRKESIHSEENKGDTRPMDGAKRGDGEYY